MEEQTKPTIMCGIQHIPFLGNYYFYISTEKTGLETSGNFPNFEECEIALEANIEMIKDEYNLDHAEIDRVDGIDELQG